MKKPFFVLKRRITYSAFGEFYLNRKAERINDIKVAKKFKTAEEAMSFAIKNLKASYRDYFAKKIKE